MAVSHTPCMRCNGVCEPLYKDFKQRVSVRIPLFLYPHKCLKNYRVMKQKEEKESRSNESVEVFNFSLSSTPIRVQVINGEPWFVAKDAARILGYANPRKAIGDHCKEKGVTFRYPLTKGGVQKLKFINEGNLYRLIVNSTLPAAEEFEEWLFNEVLPSIRRKGYYSAAIDACTPIAGVFPMLYQGKVYYPYTPLLKAVGYSTRSGSVQSRRRQYPQQFVKYADRNWITPDMANLLVRRHEALVLQQELKKAQPMLPFKEETVGEADLSRQY